MLRTQPLYAPEFRRQVVDLVRAGRDAQDLAREFEPSTLAILQGFAEADPDQPRWKGGLCGVGSGPGDLMAGRRTPGEALAACRAARAACGALADAEPSDAGLRWSVAEIDAAIGDALAGSGLTGGAVALSGAEPGDGRSVERLAQQIARVP